MAQLTPGSAFSFPITQNVTYGETCLFSESRRLVAQHQADTLMELAHFVQKCRDHFKAPAVITSGHRPPSINAMVGGASQSEHLFNAPDTGALDFYLDGVAIIKVQEWCVNNWPCSVGLGAPKGFVHVGMRPGRPRVVWPY